MLQVIVAGYLGADAEVRGEQGHEFTTFRVAHTDRWTGQDGVSHDATTWVDCVLNGRPNVVPFLRKATQVVVIGTASLRVYSSPRDRCMKAGMQVSVRSVELMGGVRDAVPSRLYDPDGIQHDVTKRYFVDVKSTTLMSLRGEQYAVDAHGVVCPSVAQIAAAGDAGSADVSEPNSSSDGAPF